jgi:hypothetical protein
MQCPSVSAIADDRCVCLSALHYVHVWPPLLPQACYKICAVRTPTTETSSTEATSMGTGAAAGKQASQLLTDADVAAAQAAPGAEHLLFQHIGSRHLLSWHRLLINLT